MRSLPDEQPGAVGCAAEPIHIPGRIQPHGMLLAVDADAIVVFASDNLEIAGCQTSEQALGMSLADLVGAALASQIMACPEIGRLHINEPLHIGTLPTDTAPRQAILWAHRHDGRVILEIEPDPSHQVGAALPVNWIHDVQQAMQATRTTAELAASLADSVRAATQYSHIMVYEFDCGWNGDVVAESRAPWIDVSYLGLHFPATDIPSQARQLYRRQLLRVVADSHEPGVAVLGLGDASPLDMSFASLRSVSPIHLEYLRNMGVRATIVSSILVGDAFWGLVVGHERSASRVPTLVERKAFQIASTLAGGILAAQAVVATLAMNRIIEASIDRIAGRLAVAGPVRAIALEYPALAPAFGLDAMVVQIDGETLSEGLATPALAPMADPELCLITERFIDRFALAPVADQDLPRQIVGGCLFRIGDDPGSLLLLGRAEHEYVVHWGGAPQTPDGGSAQDLAESAGPLRPRTSFAAWKQVVQGRSQAFSRTESAALEQFRQRLTGILRADRDRLRRERANFDERMAAIGRLAGGVAHDLNNFLAVIGINLDIALDLAADTEIEELLEISQRAVQNSAEVTAALLTFARRQRLSPTAIDVRPFLLKFQAMVQPLMGRQLRLVGEPGDVALRCRADAGLLETAMLNIATNARDSIHTGAGEIRISVAALHAVQPIAGLGGEIPKGEYVVFCISDSGDGMPADVLARAAEPFFTTKEQGQGTGLGLPMVLGFAAQSGGTVTIESKPGTGTKVCIILPRVMDDATGQALQPDIEAPSVLQGLRLLVVEDNETLAQALRTMALREGILVSVAASVPEAQALIETSSFDAMLCDFMLGATGTALDVIAIPRALKHDIPTVVMTGYSNASTDQLERLAPYRILRKPFKRADLVAALSAELSRVQ